MSQTPIRIGVIGAGGIVKLRHLPGFRDLDGCEVVTVHNRRRESAEAVAREWNIPQVADRPEDVWQRDDVDAVVIGTPPYVHRDFCIAALEAGKHVFCQARMAGTLAEARDMLRAAEAHPDRVTMVCPPPHVMPGERFVQDLLAAGELGELRLVRLRALNDAWLDPAKPHNFRSSKRLSGHNVMALGIYNEVFNRWYGPSRTVTATGKAFTAGRHDPETGRTEPVELPESLAVSGELENGGHYVYTLSAVAPFSPGDSIEIYGTRGALFYDVAAQEIRIGRVGSDERARPVPIPEDVKGSWHVEADFVRAIREGTPVSPDFREGVRYMEFVEAAARSLDEGRTLTLPLP